VGVSACSDLGTGWDEGWISYDLPYGHISMPSELALAQSVGATPVNPEYVGLVNDHTLRIQFCIYEPPCESAYRNYQEQVMALNGCKAILFKSLGVFHQYDSHFSTLVGMKAYLRPDRNPVVVLVEIESPEAEEVAVAILMTMRP
jgi:hypothetical protein